MPKILMSGCFLGRKVRYDGKDNLQTHARLQALIEAGDIVEICPEVAGGLPVPRPPAEIEPGKTALEVLDGKARILTTHGEDVTEQYLAGAQKALALARAKNVTVAILKARSPSCGSQQVYDGTFSRQLVAGMGITAALLQLNGIKVFDESQIDLALDIFEQTCQREGT